MIERHEQRALRPAIIVRIDFERLQPLSAGGHEPGPCLAAGQHEDAHVRRVGQILHAVHGKVPQRGDAAAVPIFRPRVDKEYFRLLAGGDARAKPVPFAGDGIGGDFVTNREDGLRERPELVRLRESLVEAAEATCRRCG